MNIRSKTMNRLGPLYNQLICNLDTLQKKFLYSPSAPKVCGIRRYDEPINFLRSLRSLRGHYGFFCKINFFAVTTVTTVTTL